METLQAEGRWYNGLTYQEAESIQLHYHAQRIREWLEEQGVPQEEIETEMVSFSPAHTEFKIYKKYQFYPLSLDIPREKDRYKNTAILFWCLKNPVPKGGRHVKLFKNLAILLLQMKIPEKQRTQYAQLIMTHAADIRDKKDVQHWMAFFRNRKDARYNTHEVNSWCKLHNLQHLIKR